MSGRAWDGFLPARDRSVFEAAGYGQRLEPGRRPALLVVDVTHEFVGDRREPILDSIRRFNKSCGEAGWDAMEHIHELLDAARARAIPVFYTKAWNRATKTTSGAWAWKNARQLEEVNEAPGPGPGDDMRNQIPELIAPLPSETVIAKTKPSAFFGTPLSSFLTALAVDTLIVTGGSTSGCVRATVVDAFSLNYRVLVPEEAVFDRGELAHAASLFDIDAKYGSVVSIDEVLDHLRGVPLTTDG